MQKKNFHLGAGHTKKHVLTRKDIPPPPKSTLPFSQKWVTANRIPEAQDYPKDWGLEQDLRQSSPPIFCGKVPAVTPQKTNMTREKQAFEDVSPIKHEVILQLAMLVFGE